MNDEPTYVFIRGTGWVPEVARRLLCTDMRGFSVWLVDRRPVKGERYIAKPKYNRSRWDRYHMQDNLNVPDLQRFQRGIMRYTTFENLKVRVSNSNFSDNKFYITVESA